MPTLKELEKKDEAKQIDFELIENFLLDSNIKELKSSQNRLRQLYAQMKELYVQKETESTKSSYLNAPLSQQIRSLSSGKTIAANEEYNQFIQEHIAHIRYVQLDILKNKSYRARLLCMERWISMIEMFMERGNFDKGWATFLAFKEACIDRLITNAEAKISEMNLSIAARTTLQKYTDLMREGQRNENRELRKLMEEHDAPIPYFYLYGGILNKLSDAGSVDESMTDEEVKKLLKKYPDLASILEKIPSSLPNEQKEAQLLEYAKGKPKLLKLLISKNILPEQLKAQTAARVEAEPQSSQSSCSSHSESSNPEKEKNELNERDSNLRNFTHRIVAAEVVNQLIPKLLVNFELLSFLINESYVYVAGVSAKDAEQLFYKDKDKLADLIRIQNPRFVEMILSLYLMKNKHYLLNTKQHEKSDELMSDTISVSFLQNLPTNELIPVFKSVQETNLSAWLAKVSSHTKIKKNNTSVNSSKANALLTALKAIDIKLEENLLISTESLLVYIATGKYLQSEEDPELKARKETELKKIFAQNFESLKDLKKIQIFFQCAAYIKTINENLENNIYAKLVDIFKKTKSDEKYNQEFIEILFQQSFEAISSAVSRPYKTSVRSAKEQKKDAKFLKSIHFILGTDKSGSPQLSNPAIPLLNLGTADSETPSAPERRRANTAPPILNPKGDHEGSSTTSLNQGGDEPSPISPRRRKGKEKTSPTSPRNKGKGETSPRKDKEQLTPRSPRVDKDETSPTLSQRGVKGGSILRLFKQTKSTPSLPTVPGAVKSLYQPTSPKESAAQEKVGGSAIQSTEVKKPHRKKSSSTIGLMGTLRQQLSPRSTSKESQPISSEPVAEISQHSQNIVIAEKQASKSSTSKIWNFTSNITTSEPNQHLTHNVSHADKSETIRALVSPRELSKQTSNSNIKTDDSESIKQDNSTLNAVTSPRYDLEEVKSRQRITIGGRKHKEPEGENVLRLRRRFQRVRFEDEEQTIASRRKLSLSSGKPIKTIKKKEHTRKPKTIIAYVPQSLQKSVSQEFVIPSENFGNNLFSSKSETSIPGTEVTFTTNKTC